MKKNESGVFSERNNGAAGISIKVAAFQPWMMAAAEVSRAVACSLEVENADKGLGPKIV